MTSRLIFLASFFMVISLTTSALPADNESPQVPFNNRIVFSQTPEIGTKWHPGIRNIDILCWDVYWNINNWVSVDVLSAGIPRIPLADTATGDTTYLTDKVTMFTLKTRPFSLELFNHPYKIGLGVTGYSTIFEFYNPLKNEGLKADTFPQGGLFVTQSLYLKNRELWFIKGSGYINLLTGFQSHRVNNARSLTSWYIIPGCRFFFNQPRGLSFELEYYIMNPYELPVKTLQVITDPDELPFENPNLHFISFMFWGLSWSWKHAQIGLHVGHHYTFSGPIIPMIGLGWDF